MANMTCQNEDFATINGNKSNNILQNNLKSHTQMKIIYTKAFGGKNVISTDSRWLPNPKWPSFLQKIVGLSSMDRCKANNNCHIHTKSLTHMHNGCLKCLTIYFMESSKFKMADKSNMAAM